jgi:beta-lactamase regulating signal transducer with metallopeptidase domain
MTPAPMAEVAVVVMANAVVAWTLTYIVHSTLMVVGALIATRVITLSPIDAVRVWKFAFLAPLVTAAAHAFGAWTPFSLDLSRVAPAALASWPIAAALLMPLALVPLAVLAAWIAGRLTLRRALGMRRPATGTLQEEVAAMALATSCRRPQLTVSETAAVPAAVGTSEICVPLSLFATLPTDEQRALLAHEMGHLARRDPLWLAVAGTIAYLTVFQPLNRLALRKLRAACEHAADDFAVRVTGDATALARALTALTTMVVALSSASATGSPVVERVGRLLDDEAPRRPPTRRATRLVAATIMLFVVASFAPGVSVSPDDAAGRIPWLTPSREEPNPRMLEVRRITREWRHMLQRAQLIR